MVSRQRRVQKSCEAALGSSLEAVARNEKNARKIPLRFSGHQVKKQKKSAFLQTKVIKKDAKTRVLASFRYSEIICC